MTTPMGMSPSSAARSPPIKIADARRPARAVLGLKQAAKQRADKLLEWWNKQIFPGYAASAGTQRTAVSSSAKLRAQSAEVKFPDGRLEERIVSWRRSTKWMDRPSGYALAEYLQEASRDDFTCQTGGVETEKPHLSSDYVILMISIPWSEFVSVVPTKIPPGGTALATDSYLHVR
ncbi:hypothetical protein C8J57DRAFT_1474206 [Mycena rebaudengoi]|nr:hypothetical protein C8J57DRAFT_1474206 [Mycena rebaudengoi]